MRWSALGFYVTWSIEKVFLWDPGKGYFVLCLFMFFFLFHSCTHFSKMSQTTVRCSVLSALLYGSSDLWLYMCHFLPDAACSALTCSSKSLQAATQHVLWRYRKWWELRYMPHGFPHAKRLSYVTLDEHRPLLSSELTHVHFSPLTSFVTTDTCRLLTGLRYVQFQRGTDAQLSVLSVLTQLQELNLSWCQGFTDKGLLTLSALTQLRHLDLSGCRYLTDQGVRSLSGLVQLRHVALESCSQLTDASLSLVTSTWSELRRLSVSNCRRLTDTSFLSLSRLRNLEHLDLWDCQQLTDQGALCVSALTQLRVLILWGCKRITDATMSYLGHCTRLQNLNLGHCRTFTYAGFLQLSSLSRLQRLQLQHCYSLTDTTLIHMVRLLPELRSLDLTGNANISDRGMAAVVQLTQLKCLLLKQCRQITDTGLYSLSGLTHLQKLDLNNCSQLTDVGLGYLSRLTQLRILHLGECGKLSDRGIQTVSRQHPQLWFLHLSGCTQITDVGFASLVAIRRLKLLSFSGCYKITTAAKLELSRLLPYCYM